MKRSFCMLTTLFFFASNVAAYCQGNKGGKTEFTVYIAKRGNIEQEVQIKVDASSGGNQLVIKCNNVEGPCLVSSALPPGLPKCIPLTCLTNLWFLGDIPGPHPYHRMRIIMSGKQITLTYKTIGETFSKTMRGMINIKFNLKSLDHK